ncbi:molybdopterin molybdotransferase MoeA [Devriesea agamarum]|uniref:molybdopterin molybdotransferase MoeA n=1 Tax=Devriesea agamarum TaxID=472569 RepID=UPI00082BDA4B|nr:gephyrin-like molybdotransferase Glp [Devriesea agamarum]
MHHSTARHSSARQGVPADTAREDIDTYADRVRALLASSREPLTLPLSAALGRCAWDEITSSVDVPGVDNSAMDGYAVRAEDLPTLLDNGMVTQDSSSARGVLTSDATAYRIDLPLASMTPAGAPPVDLPPGHAAPIMTGAAMPHGADCVIPVECSALGRFSHEAADRVELRIPVEMMNKPLAGLYVRRRGSDTHAGANLVAAGDRLTPSRLALLASCGISEVEVVRPRRVLVLSTGTELVAPGALRTDGLAFDANTTGIRAMLEDMGAEVIASEVVSDDPMALRELIGTYTGMIDLVVSSGGVSAGAFEVVKQAAQLPGKPAIDLTFTRVGMQPGGPQGLGTVTLGAAQIPWIALPGNPVSALLSVELFVRPALRGGTSGRVLARLPLRLPEGTVTSPEGLVQWRRARVAGDGVSLVGGPSSHLLGAFADSNCLIRVPADVTILRDGDEVDVRILG